MKKEVNIDNHDIAITAIQSIFTVCNKSEALKGRISFLGIVIDTTHGISDVPIISII